jgi:hypothetical protein
MTDYRYVGVADEVVVTKEDFERHDIDHDEVVFNADNDQTVKLSSEAADFLVSQGFQLMKREDFDAMVKERAAQEAATTEAVAAAAPSDAQLAAAGAGAVAPLTVPERPGADATRDELADFAWTNYMIPVDTEDHKMTKAEITKALDKAEKERQAQIDAGQGESSAETVPGDQAGEGQMGPGGAGTTAVPGHGTTTTT